MGWCVAWLGGSPAVSRNAPPDRASWQTSGLQSRAARCTSSARCAGKSAGLARVTPAALCALCNQTVTLCTDQRSLEQLSRHRWLRPRCRDAWTAGGAHCRPSSAIAGGRPTGCGFSMGAEPQARPDQVRHPGGRAAAPTPPSPGRLCPGQPDQDFHPCQSRPCSSH